MNNDLSLELQRYRFELCAFARCGSGENKLHENGLFDPDLNPGNFIYNEKENAVYRIDFDKAKIRDYLTHWKLLPICLKSFFRWATVSQASAFRFGYMQSGGPIAKEIFKILLDKHNISIFSLSDKLKLYKKGLNTKSHSNDITCKHRAWVENREKVSKYGSLGHSFVEQNIAEWINHRKEIDLSNQYDANIYVYQRNLVHSYFHFSLLKQVEGLINLAGVIKQSDIEKSIWIMEYCHKLQTEYSQYISSENWSLFNSLYDIVKSDKVYSKINFDDEILELDLFEFLWAIDDMKFYI